MKRFDQINVIPFIDIMLVMLAIVLTTASFIATGELDIDVAEANSQAVPSLENAVEIAIDRDSQIFFRQQSITLENLESELTKLSSQTRVILRIDKSVPFGRFVSVLDSLKSHQINNFSVVTRQTQ